MTNEELNLKIKSAFMNIAPDSFQQILSDSKNNKGSVVLMTTNKNNYFKKFAAVAAAFVVFLAGVIGFAVSSQQSNVVSTVSLDVNPSINIQLNKKEKVIDVVPLNDDAKKIIGTMKFEGADLTVTINALVGSMLRNGYLSDIANSLLVTVEGKDHSINEALRKRVEEEINAVLNGANFNASILNQEIDKDDKLEAFAEKNGISEGKAKLVLKLSEQFPNHKAEELAKLTINELNLLAENTKEVTANGSASKKAYINKSKLSEILLKKAGLKNNEIESFIYKMEYDDGMMVYEVDFDAKGYKYEAEVNATTGEILEFDREPSYELPAVSNTENPSKTTPVYIGENKAKKIALEHAGLNDTEAENIRCTLTDDDGVKVYDIEFISNGYEYDVEVSAVKGVVTDFDKEPINTNHIKDIDDDERDDDYDDDNYKKSAETTTSLSKDSTYITRDKAREIALAKAGVAASDAQRLICKLDTDDGIATYDVEFISGKYEYSIEINAVTGIVIDYDKEIDD